MAGLLPITDAEVDRHGCLDADIAPRHRGPPRLGIADRSRHFAGALHWLALVDSQDPPGQRPARDPGDRPRGHDRPPIARGVGGKVSPRSRYFPYYTRPWISDADFDPDRDPHLTEDEARAIDSAIDAYNQTIIDSVASARAEGLDWYLFDMGGLLDRLATRRYTADRIPRGQDPPVTAIREGRPRRRLWCRRGHRHPGN
jgi:hypothetical protein